MTGIKETIGDIEDNCGKEHTDKAPQKNGSETYIEFMSNNLGQDFALKIMGNDVAVCKRIFDELYHKIKKGSAPRPVKNDGAYH